MADWIAGYIGAEYAPLVYYVLMGLAALIGLLVLIRLFRKLTHGTFVSGGRNAQPRISVQDAAPVDSHRRLVLVRRDDVEHLLLIGGNTDIVVEQNIRTQVLTQRSPSNPEPVGMRERPGGAEPVAYPAPPPRVIQPVTTQPRPLATPTLPRPVVAQPPLIRQEPHADPIVPSPPVVRSEPPVYEPLKRLEPRAPQPVEPTSATAPGITSEGVATKSPDQSLDDELEKMLGDFEVFSPPKP